MITISNVSEFVRDLLAQTPEAQQATLKKKLQIKIHTEDFFDFEHDRPTVLRRVLLNMLPNFQFLAIPAALTKNIFSQLRPNQTANIQVIVSIISLLKHQTIPFIAHAKEDQELLKNLYQEFLVTEPSFYDDEFFIFFLDKNSKSGNGVQDLLKLETRKPFVLQLVLTALNIFQSNKHEHYLQQANAILIEAIRTQIFTEYDQKFAQIVEPDYFALHQIACLGIENDDHLNTIIQHFSAHIGTVTPKTFGQYRKHPILKKKIDIPDAVMAAINARNFPLLEYLLKKNYSFQKPLPINLSALFPQPKDAKDSKTKTQSFSNSHSILALHLLLNKPFLKFLNPGNIDLIHLVNPQHLIFFANQKQSLLNNNLKQMFIATLLSFATKAKQVANSFPTLQPTVDFQAIEEQKKLFLI